MSFIWLRKKPNRDASLKTQLLWLVSMLFFIYLLETGCINVYLHPSIYRLQSANLIKKFTQSYGTFRFWLFSLLLFQSYQTLFVKKITFFFTHNSSLLWPNFIKKKFFFYKTLRGTIPFDFKDFLLSISRIIVFFYISYDNLSLFSPNVMKCLCNVKIVLGKFTFDFDDFYICCSNT